jgi:hypothetical protein
VPTYMNGCQTENSVLRRVSRKRWEVVGRAGSFAFSASGDAVLSL